MEAVHEIRSKNKGNYDKSIALAKEGTGLSHGAVRFILGRLHPNVLRGGNPVEQHLATRYRSTSSHPHRLH